MQEPIRVGGIEIPPGHRQTLDLSIAPLQTHAEMAMPIQVVHGARPGPRLFVTAAVHGDEINGVEIIHRLLQRLSPRRLRGAVLAVPVVNVYGFINQSRYLPDRRDLNRFFPGSETGSLASRVAELLMQEVVSHCTHGIDLHTGSNHRSNLPQIRACLDHPETMHLARAFGAPVILNANLRDGSLRQAALEQDIPMLLYEAGEALRFNEVAIRAGVKGILAVMRAIRMLPARRSPKKRVEPLIARSSSWVRAPVSGILRIRGSLGNKVEKQTVLGTIEDPFGEHESQVCAPSSGIIIGRLNLPLVYAGDALFHIARFDPTKAVDAALQAFETDPDLYDERGDDDGSLS
ncbi:MAG: succinylglutamate desuccinylase/aspartoacylase family protein [Candidatus Tectomicrobia bacterium]|nr:succinylglutamate desuccinylase/aspartoacylase family protein [Candidatus Tectomicrobia bacterium]